MKISTRGEYGIRAMLYIAMHGEERPVTSHEIAGHQAIPEPYLRQILALLSKDRLIHSNRGPQGGHALGRPAESISLRDVLMTLEGQTTSVDQILSLPCAIDIGTEYCAIREVLLEVREAVERILSRVTLADLVTRQRLILDQKIQVPFFPQNPCLPVIND
ncbi:MAG TPA: Rrf2 family transcriptional regulator [Thermoanaerobaculia bacterium]|nr:Rrf2 family transcriptional regulator [Thermoanaerobaculia bacterium]